MRTLRSRIAWVFSLSVVFYLCLSILPVLGGECKVIRVLDGDTIKVRTASVEMTIRLVAIDAPEVSHKKREPGQPYSQQATKYLAGLVLNKTVDLKEYGHDRYGRILGVVSFGGKNINLEMIEAGFAEVYRGDLLAAKILALTGRPRKKPRLQKEECGCKGRSTLARWNGGKVITLGEAYREVVGRYDVSRLAQVRCHFKEKTLIFGV